MNREWPAPPARLAALAAAVLAVHGALLQATPQLLHPPAAQATQAVVTGNIEAPRATQIPPRPKPVPNPSPRAPRAVQSAPAVQPPQEPARSQESEPSATAATGSDVELGPVIGAPEAAPQQAFAIPDSARL